MNDIKRNIPFKIGLRLADNSLIGYTETHTAPFNMTRQWLQADSVIPNTPDFVRAMNFAIETQDARSIINLEPSKIVMEEVK